VRPFLPGVLKDGEFALVSGGEVGVAAFAAEGDEAVQGRDHARAAQAGAGPQHADHGIGGRLAAADLHQVARRQVRQRHRQRGEVVHDQQGGQAQRAAHLVGRELPVAVGHPDEVAIDRIGQGEGGVVEPHALVVGQVFAQQRQDVAVVVTLEHAHRTHHTRRGFESEARVGGADVGEQTGAVGVGRAAVLWFGFEKVGHRSQKRQFLRSIPYC